MRTFLNSYLQSLLFEKKTRNVLVTYVALVKSKFQCYKETNKKNATISSLWYRSENSL